ncbi:hypothetical protein EYC08_17895 [Tabrizicola sp. WMC-M-20]|nr:hypothetical protein EYC08_17895 [Tabrizicola sp. WMC-M-20]
MRVVNALQAQGFIAAMRGCSSGLRLAHPAAPISMGAVFRVFESGTPFAECFDQEANI